MTKKEIVKQIADEIGLTQTQTKQIVQRTFDLIIQTLMESDDHRIELRNFGVFEVKPRKGRQARNPRTGQPVTVPDKVVVTFKPGKKMAELIGRLNVCDFRPKPEPGHSIREPITATEPVLSSQP